MDLLDRLVVALDRWQRRRLGIWEFSDDPACVFRLGLTRSPFDARLADGTVVHQGDIVAVIHLSNERMPLIPPGGPDLAWARGLSRSLIHSLRLLAHYVATSPALDAIQAFGGWATFAFTPGTIRMLNRLGMEAVDPLPQHGAQWFVDLGARIWVWLLRRAFNPQSVRGLRLGDIQRRPFWMSKRTLLALHRPRSSPPPDARSEMPSAP
jgi:hypothetical protein